MFEYNLSVKKSDSMNQFEQLDHLLEKMTGCCVQSKLNLQ